MERMLGATCGEIIHAVPYGARDPYLELASKYWRATRARMDPKELAALNGHITVPTPLPMIAQEQRSTD